MSDTNKHDQMVQPETPKTTTGAQSVIDGLVAAGCEVLFGYPGGAVLELDALYDAP